jgi:hypothetical protein
MSSSSAWACSACEALTASRMFLGSGRRAEVDPARAVECFRRYLEHEGAKVSRAEMEMNLHGKLADPAFAADIAPLLAPGAEWDAAAAADYVRRELVSRLPGEPWKGGE